MTASSAALLAAARMMPLGWVAPPLGGPSRAARIVVGLLLSALVMPSLSSLPPPPSLPLAMMQELLVGLFLGMTAAIPLRAAEAAGGILDGATHPWRAALDGGELDGAKRERPLATAYGLFALALFAAFDGPRLVVVAAAKSYAALPAAHGFDVAAANVHALSANVHALAANVPALPANVPALPHGLDGAALALVLGIGARLVASAVTLAAPSLAALLVADVAFALVARAQPKFAAAVEAAPLRLGVVVLALAAGALAVAHALTRAFADAAALGLTP